MAWRRAQHFGGRSILYQYAVHFASGRNRVPRERTYQLSAFRHLSLRRDVGWIEIAVTGGPDRSTSTAAPRTPHASSAFASFSSRPIPPSFHSNDDP